MSAAGVIETLILERESSEAATAAELDVATLVARVSNEVREFDSTLIGHSQIAAWARL